MPEIHEHLQDVLEGEDLRPAADKGDVVDGEAGLQRGVLEQGVEHYVGVVALLDAEYDPDAFP